LKRKLSKSCKISKKEKIFKFVKDWLRKLNNLAGLLTQIGPRNIIIEDFYCFEVEKIFFIEFLFDFPLFSVLLTNVYLGKTIYNRLKSCLVASQSHIGQKFANIEQKSIRQAVKKFRKSRRSQG
jgi:hypothetical protein